MIRTIWSHFVKVTWRRGGEPGSSGTPPIVPSSGSGSEMERRLHEQLSKRWGTTDRLIFAWWNMMATVRHWFGIHTMIQLEEWDFIEEVVQMKGMVCWKCDFEL